jgi:hypothetical protein
VHFVSVDGAVRQVLLGAIPRPLTRTAHARKSLNASLPPVEVAETTAEIGETPAAGTTSKSPAGLRSKGN